MQLNQRVAAVIFFLIMTPVYTIPSVYQSGNMLTAGNQGAFEAAQSPAYLALAENGRYRIESLQGGSYFLNGELNSLKDTSMSGSYLYNTLTAFSMHSLFSGRWGMGLSIGSSFDPMLSKISISGTPVSVDGSFSSESEAVNIDVNLAAAYRIDAEYSVGWALAYRNRSETDENSISITNYEQNSVETEKYHETGVILSYLYRSEGDELVFRLEPIPWRFGSSSTDYTLRQPTIYNESKSVSYNTPGISTAGAGLSSIIFTDFQMIFDALLYLPGEINSSLYNFNRTAIKQYDRTETHDFGAAIGFTLLYRITPSISLQWGINAKQINSAVDEKESSGGRIIEDKREDLVETSIAASFFNDKPWYVTATVEYNRLFFFSDKTSIQTGASAESSVTTITLNGISFYIGGGYVFN